MSAEIVIVDYGMSNLNSVRRMFDRLDAAPLVSSRARDIIGARKIILPGIGHFGRAMDRLRELDLIDALGEAITVKRCPTLGICLGMQLLTKRSEEGAADGLGWFDAETVKFNASDARRFKIPHMGWNVVRATKDSCLLKGIPAEAEFYFVHSYHVRLNHERDALGETVYDGAFTSAIEKDHVFGVQFHPEKSRQAGARLLKNFIEL